MELTASDKLSTYVSNDSVLDNVVALLLLVDLTALIATVVISVEVTSGNSFIAVAVAEE